MATGGIALAIILMTACSEPATAPLGASPGGHYATYNGRTRMLVGDSGTQCVTQNANLDYRAWVDDCAARDIAMVHVWSFLAPRQKQDGSEIEERWGYVYPGLTPWARRDGGPPAEDQLPCWDLQRFDDGPDGDLTRYWPRVRDLCAYAKSKGLVVGYTVFTGWAKGNSNAWPYHPLNVRNGGHLTINLPDAVTIASPGTEVWRETWSDAWPDAKKTQWIWERLAAKAIEDLAPFGNVVFMFFDERSYSEGNMGDHFLQFFKRRGALWTDGELRRADVDFVMSDTSPAEDRNALAVAGFAAEPVRPYLLLEGSPYRGDGLRTSMWTFALGGGHYTFHGDEGQETPRTGIMGYDPHAPEGDKGMLKRDWLGHLSRFFNSEVRDLDAMRPCNELAGDAGVYCLAHPGVEYVVYAGADAARTFRLDLRNASGIAFTGRFYDPRDGRFAASFPVQGGSIETFTKPADQDYTLHLVRASDQSD